MNPEIPFPQPLKRCRKPRQSRNAFRRWPFGIWPANPTRNSVLTSPENSRRLKASLRSIRFHRKDFLKMRRDRCGFLTAPDQRFHNDSKISVNYPRRERGGARPTWTNDGLDETNQRTTPTSSNSTSGATSHTAFATGAGAPCIRLTQAELLSTLAWRTVRLLVADSSISARIACRSSEAEITGNSKTSTHPSASKHCSGVILRASRASVSRRHSQ
jgi:hypothetical protein